MARPPAVEPDETRPHVGKFIATSTCVPSARLVLTIRVWSMESFISYHRRTDHMREQNFKTCHTTHKRRYSRRVPNKFYASARRHSRWHLILAQTLHET